MDRQAHDNRLCSVLLRAGIAAALPATELETDYLGETSDTLKAKAAEFAAGQTDRVTTVAENVVEAVTEEARKQGLTLEGAKSAAGDVSAKVGRVVDAAGKRHIRAGDVVEVMAASGVAGVFITPSHSLPVAERELFVQFILSGDAGFAILEVAAIAVCPSPLIEGCIPEAAKGRFGRVSRTHIKFSKQRNIVPKGKLQAKFSNLQKARSKWLIHPKWLVQTSTEILPKSVQSVPLTTSAR